MAPSIMDGSLIAGAAAAQAVPDAAYILCPPITVGVFVLTHLYQVFFPRTRRKSKDGNGSRSVSRYGFRFLVLFSSAVLISFVRASGELM
jgi:hypothetical protein